jgi:hypothetical protein
VLDRISYDLDVISRAFDQREIYDDTSLSKKVLAKADFLANEALKPAKSRGLIDGGTDDTEIETKAISYLQKSFETRVIPYADVSLIGIPLTSVRLTEDLLAIPHEVGHYVFWNGDRNKLDGENRLEPLRQSNFPWTEEIFADVYGCIVAGPVIALDFQDLQLEFAGLDPVSTTNEFEEGVDDEHPTPILRPSIYTDILRKMNQRDVNATPPGDLDEIATQLNNRWKDKLEARGYPRESSELTSGLQFQVSNIINYALDIFDVKSSVTGFWSKNNIQDDVEALYNEFYKFAGEPHGQRPAIPATEIVDAAGRQKIFAVDWLPEFRAAGWTTKGPHGRS